MSVSVGLVDPAVREEFPGLRLHWTAVEATVRSSPPEVARRLGELSDRYRGAGVVAMRTKPIPHAYRSFFRQVGLDPDTSRIPSEEAAVGRLLHGRFRSRGSLEDARLIALVETGVPVWALDARTVDQDSFGIRNTAGRLVVAVDDTPTPRYGPCVQGAGIHHNPTPGPAGEKYVYGHIWVTLAWLVRHPAWDTLALPLRALLYVRVKDVPKLAKRYPWTFRTKLELAAELARWLHAWLNSLGKELWLVVDGAYAKRPFLKPAKALGLVVFSRLRRDADLRNVPTARRRRGQRGPLPTYGKERIDLAKRAGQNRGWQQLACVQYGQRVVKTLKTFEATWRPAGGRIRVVIVREDEGWLPYFCTDPAMPVVAIVEAMADRGAIEQLFHDVKEVWGAAPKEQSLCGSGIFSTFVREFGRPVYNLPLPSRGSRLSGRQLMRTLRRGRPARAAASYVASVAGTSL